MKPHYSSYFPTFQFRRHHLKYWGKIWTELKQGSLADAKARARQQCMYEGPLAKKSIANQPCDFLLMVNSNHGRITYRLWEFSRIELENSNFSPTVFRLCRLLAEERQAWSSCIHYWKSTFSELQLCRWQYKSVFNCLSAIASEICEITRNSEKIQTDSSLRASKVIDFSVNRKHIFGGL